MDKITRILSRPAAKPYRTKHLSRYDQGDLPFLNSKGLLDFAPGDVENPKNWSKPRRWFITFVSVLLVVNATFASSSPSGALNSLAEELHVSDEAASLVVSVFLLGYVPSYIPSQCRIANHRLDMCSDRCSGRLCQSSSDVVGSSTSPSRATLPSTSSVPSHQISPDYWLDDSLLARSRVPLCPTCPASSSTSGTPLLEETQWPHSV